MVTIFLARYDREFSEVLDRKKVLALKFLLDAGVSAAAEAAHGLAPLLPQLSQGVCRRAQRRSEFFFFQMRSVSDYPDLLLDLLKMTLSMQQQSHTVLESVGEKDSITR